MIKWVNEKIRKEIKKFLDSNENEDNTYLAKPMGHSKDNSKWEVYSNECPHQKIREMLHK
jgi:hypothetical protein